jgi:hypothetical protein
MRLTESQLRKIVRQEILREGFVFTHESKFGKEADMMISNSIDALISKFTRMGATCSPASRYDRGNAMIAHYCNFANENTCHSAKVEAHKLLMDNLGWSLSENPGMQNVDVFLHPEIRYGSIDIEHNSNQLFVSAYGSR